MTDTPKVTIRCGNWSQEITPEGDIILLLHQAMHAYHEDFPAELKAMANPTLEAITHQEGNATVIDGYELRPS